jgi:hypothetical protein
MEALASTSRPVQAALRLGVRGTDVQILVRLLRERSRYTVELALAMPWIDDFDGLIRKARKALRRNNETIVPWIRGSHGGTLWGLGLLAGPSREVL